MNTQHLNFRFGRRALIPAFTSLLLLAVGACQQSPTTAGATLGGSSTPQSQYFSNPTTPNSAFTGTTGTTGTGATGGSAGLIPSSSAGLSGLLGSYPNFLYGQQGAGYNWQGYYQQSFWNSLFPGYNYTAPGNGVPLVYQAVGNIAFSTTENSHILGTPCTALGNYQTVGTIADGGNGELYGNEVICKTFITENTAHPDSQTVVVDFFVTAENSHIVGGPGCPAGYTMVGTGADGGDGQLYGNQNYCMFSVPASSVTSTSTVVQDVIITPEGAHIVGGPGCPAGYTMAGSNADGGNGQLYGNQLVCVKKAAL